MGEVVEVVVEAEEAEEVVEVEKVEAGGQVVIGVPEDRALHHTGISLPLSREARSRR